MGCNGILPRNPGRPKEDTAMNRVCSIFSQMLQNFPLHEFEAAVKEHKAERHAADLNAGRSLWPCCSAN